MENTTFNQLLNAALAGGKLIDPRVGKHDHAILSECRAVVDNPEALHITLTFPDLVDNTGKVFTHTAMVFMPREFTSAGGETPYFVKARFMQLLKGLGVVPQDYTQMLLFQTAESVEMLAAMIGEHVGQSYNITIGMDNRGYYTTTIRG